MWAALIHVARGTDRHDEANAHSSRLRERVGCHSLSCRWRQGPYQKIAWFRSNIQHYLPVPYDARCGALVERTWTSVTSKLRYIVAHVCTWLKASTPQHAQPPTQRVPGFSAHPRHTHRPRREADHSLHLPPTLNAWLSTSTINLDEVVYKWVQEHIHRQPWHINAYWTYSVIGCAYFLPICATSDIINSTARNRIILQIFQHIFFRYNLVVNEVKQKF